MERECQIFHKKSKNKPTAAGILFPTCISVNSRFCFVSPHSTDDTTLAPNDIIKIEMSFDTDGCIASVVHTHMVAEKLSGRTAEVFYAAGISRDCVLRDMKHGTTKKELFESSISPALDGYGCKLLQFDCDALERPSHKSMSDDDAFQLNKAYTIDLVISSNETRFEEEDTADVFRFMPLDEIKAKSFPIFFVNIRMVFKQRAFSIRSLEGRGDADLIEFHSRKSEFLQPYRILCTKDGVPVVRFKFMIFLTKEGPQDKTPVMLQKPEVAGKHDMCYCGKVPIGSNAMGSIPTVRSIAWALGNKLKRKKENVDQIVCTGSLGTCVFERTMGNLNEAKIEDLELGWTKKELSNLCGDMCACCPYENTTLALGVINEYGRADIYLLNLHEQIQNPPPFFESMIGVGLNSLSWSEDGLHLLCTFNDAKSFVVITRQRNKFKKSGHHTVQFYTQEGNSDYFGVFHPTIRIVFIAKSTGVIGVFEYDDQQQSARPDYYKKYGSCPGDGRGYCGIAVSPGGDTIICPRADGSILGMTVNYSKLANDNHEIFEILFDQYFDVPTPSVPKCSMLSQLSLFAIRDEGQILRIYDCSTNPTLTFDNKKDIDCMRAHHDFTALSELNQVLALGGKDGFLHFWMIFDEDAMPFAEKKRDFLSEKLFYAKKQLLLGSGESLRQKHAEIHSNVQVVADKMQSEILALLSKMDALGNQSAERVALLEDRIQKAVDLGKHMLSSLQHGERESLPVSEVRDLVENFVEVLTTVDD
ncbi:hypothetical protein BDA96_03G057600 [Sorghum bicolor]|nr:hypothetical protein BDA96_03G057600 [Sorghum bicolor]